MNRRVLAYLSIALYLLSLALPALREDPSSQEYQPVYVSGIACLFGLMTWSLVAFPLILLWCGNPWLWTLWFRSLRGLPTPPSLAWAAPALALGTVAFAWLGAHQTPLVGAALWIAAAVLGSLAATMKTPRSSAATP